MQENKQIATNAKDEDGVWVTFKPRASRPEKIKIKKRHTKGKPSGAFAHNGIRR